VKNKQKPEIQFEKNKENWKEIKAGSIFYSISDKNHPNLPVLSASQEKGMVFRDQIGIDIQYNIESTKTYKRVVPGQFVIHLRSFQGGFAFSTIEGITSPAYTILDFKNKEEQDVLFWKNVLSSKTFIKKLESVTYGIRDGRSISFNDFSTLKFVVPNYEAQKRIGSFFKNLDDTIALHQQELDALKQTKQGFLQKMFPKNGETEPVIRFKDFTKPWILKNFEMICESFEYGLNASAKEFDGTNQYLRITDIDDESRTFLKSHLTSPDCNLNSAEKYLLQDGDLLFARTGASVGKTYLYREKDGIVYYAGFLIRGKIKEIYDSEFVFQNTLTSNFKEFIKISSQRSGQPGINAQEIATYSFLVPGHEEQIKIGEFFIQLDEVIDLKEEELEALKQTKKGFLQKMFV